MANHAQQCPKCKGYIFGDYCFICKMNIHDYLKDDIENSNDIPDFLKDIFRK